MMEQLRGPMIAGSWALYYAYGVSVLVWLAAIGLAFRRERALPATARAPSEWEYYGLRLFVVFVLTDAVRAWDLCFATDAQLTDGACRSARGDVPMWLRAFAWWLRDMIMLAGLAYFLDFTLGWTHAVLGRSPPRPMRLLVRFGVPAICAGMSVCAAALLATNRAAWILCVVGWVAMLNVSTAAVGWQLLTSVLPDVHAVLPAAKARDAQVLLLEARVVAISMLVLAGAVFVGFLPLCAIKIWDGALHWPMVPWIGLGESIAGVHFRPLDSLPQEVTPNPAPELVELSIGWALLVGCVLLARGCPVSQPPSCGYVGCGELAASLLGKRA